MIFYKGKPPQAPALCHIIIQVLCGLGGVEDIFKGFTASIGTLSNHHPCSTGHAGIEDILQGLHR
jgi:hypothetical protein